MKNILLAFTGITIMMLGFSKCSQPKNNETPPNIILMLADDLGYNDVSCYRNATPGQADRPPTCQTPNIDYLASNGMRFTNFYTGAAVCSPSRSALITGRNATRNGIYNWIPPNQPMHLKSSEVTLAEVLKKKQYETAHFGKWHLTSEGMGQPLMNDQGYDYSFFTYNNANPSHENPENFFRNGEPVGKLEGFSCQLVVDEAIEWMDKKKASGNPFYINLWFNEPHEKVAAPDSLARRHAYNNHYYGCIENMDIAVGRVLEYIQANKLDKNTIIIFTSDNGSQVYGSNYPLHAAKGFNYEGGIRVPFIITWPERIPEGKISSTIGSFTDVLPSLASFCKIDPGEDLILDGNDLTAVFTGKAAHINRKHPVFFYRYFNDPICMLRDGDFCLLGFETPIPYAERLHLPEFAKFKPEPGEPRWSKWGFQQEHMQKIPEIIPVHFELYNLKEDIGQQNNLAHQYPEKVEEMKKQMLKLREEMLEEGGNWYQKE